MKNETLLDISEVCEMLNVTSRALRFYEEKGLITSTKVVSNRRKYSVEQVELIKKILVLRTLGLSVSKIKEIQEGDSDLRQSILEHKSKILATIVTKSKEIKLLDEALSTMEHNGNIFCSAANNEDLSAQNSTISFITDNFISGNYKIVFEKFSEVLQAYTPLSAFERIVKDTLSPLGKFLSLESVEKDASQNNVFYSYLKYEKLGLRIKFVMYGNVVHGFWLAYYEI